jgi:repressor LexA
MGILPPLTFKQRRILDFLKEHINNAGYPPTVREIARYFKMSGPYSAKRYLDMLEKKGYIRRTANSSRAIEIMEAKHVPASVRMVPLIGRVSAGTPLLAHENIECYIALDRSMAKWDSTFLLRVSGESMIDVHITHGDLALVKPQPTASNGEIVVALIDDEATIKKFYKTNTHIRLQPANSHMKPIIIKKRDTQVHILGKVVAILRNIENDSQLFKFDE